MLTQERLQYLYEYDPETGYFHWNVGGRKRTKGKVAGCIRKDGYVTLRVDGKLYLAHRLAFLYMTGEIPQFVDHINLDPSYNAWRNLRAASSSENGRNKRHQPKGCTFSAGKYQANVRFQGRNYYVGRFNTEEEATRAFLAKRAELTGEPNV